MKSAGKLDSFGWQPPFKLFMLPKEKFKSCVSPGFFVEWRLLTTQIVACCHTTFGPFQKTPTVFGRNASWGLYTVVHHVQPWKQRGATSGADFVSRSLLCPGLFFMERSKKVWFWRDAPKIYLQISWVWLIMVDLPWDTPPSIDTGSDIWWTPSLRMIGPFKAFASQCLPRHELLSNIQYLRNDQYDHINDNYGWFWVSVPFLASIFQSMLLSHSHSHDNWLTSSWLPHRATESSPCYRTGRQLGSNYGFFATNLKLAVLVPKIHWSATQNEANA